jgi:hypothetical protein
MTPYKNLSGASNVVAYEIAADSITVQFRPHNFYLYTTQSVGLSNLEQMKQLANRGFGLNSFINLRVKELYVRKWVG